MIFRSVQNPTVHYHRAPWAVSKRFSEIPDRREPPPNAMDRHPVVVALWWAPRGFACVSRELDPSPRAPRLRPPRLGDLPRRPGRTHHRAP
jgi:hypothetical protein